MFPLSRERLFALCAMALLYLFVIAMHIYQPNMGGSGLTLPLNLQSWAVMVGITLLSLLFILQRGYFTLPAPLGMMAAACLLLTLPLAWSPTIYWPNALPRLAAIWGALLFSVALLQLQLSDPHKRWLLALVLLAALAEAALSLFQWGWPERARLLMEYNVAHMGDRPYGIFQQPNLLASFLATGYAVAVWFSFALRRRGALLLGAQSVLLFTLLLTQSRVGIIGAVMALLLLSLLSPAITANDDLPRLRGYGAILLLSLMLMVVNVLFPAHAVALSAWLVSGAMAMILFATRRCPIALRRQGTIFLVAIMTVLVFSPPVLQMKSVLLGAPLSPAENVARRDFVHIDSSLSRIAILRVTMAMIAMHPLKGSGLGSFEHQWPEARVRAGVAINSYITHPHNELLYVWAEGGVTALAGLMLLFWCLLRNALQPATATPLTASAAAIAMPILLHTQLEYPLSQSAMHLLLLLLLFRIGQVEKKEQRWHLSGFLKLSCQAALPVLLTLVMGLLHGQTVQQRLTRAERNQLRSLPLNLSLLEKWTQYSRYDFDRHSALLLAYNRTRDVQDIDAYLHWSRGYLQVWQDAGVYDSAIRIAHALGRQEEEAALRRQARRAFPGDARF